MGCYVTDDVESIEIKLSQLQDDLSKELYFEPYVKSMDKNKGFHAVEDHFDIRSRVYSLIPLLNFRSYFVILNKNKERVNDEKQTYLMLLNSLLKNRLIKNKMFENIVFFEKLTFKNYSQKEILSEYFKEFINIKVTFEIIDKCNLLSLIDYQNYVLYTLLKDSDQIRKEIRMVQNFENLQPKIGLIQIANSNYFFTRFKKYTILDVYNTLIGQS